MQSAALRLAADFCAAQVSINGRSVLSVEAYSPTSDVDATSAIRPGENHIVVTGESVGGPAAIALTLDMVNAEGKRESLLSDLGWSSGTGQATSLGRVERSLWGIGRRPAAISPFDNYEQWRQASGAADASDPATFRTALDPDAEPLELHSRGGIARAELNDCIFARLARGFRQADGLIVDAFRHRIEDGGAEKHVAAVAQALDEPDPATVRSPLESLAHVAAVEPDGQLRSALRRDEGARRCW